MASGGAFKTGGKVVQLSTDAGSHSYSEEELAGIVSHINRCLASDSLLQSGTLPHGKIPIATPVDIFQALRDGVILCKFVNTFGGDKPLIPSFTSKAQMMEIHMRENISKALEAATTIKGINIINIHTAEICQGKAPHVTLGLLWQLVAYDLKLTVTRLAMANTNETATPVTVSDAERVILEWANFHLAHANVPPISNFGSDLNRFDSFTRLKKGAKLF
ncbi:Plastin-3 T-plastin [Pelomyxa schiedti]|nr:Plastin-3 T-plastin [Pelomyxa schiedti]